MKKQLSILIFVLAIFELSAQNYQISFTGSGASTTVDSVRVENLTQCTNLTLNGTDILELVAVVGVTNYKDGNERIFIYPNPARESSTIEFYAGEAAAVTVNIADVSSKIVLSTELNVICGINAIAISGLGRGVFFVNIKMPCRQLTARIISINSSESKPVISLVRNLSSDASKDIELRKTKSVVQMAYNNGETLLFTAYSGNYSTVSTLVPTGNQVLNSSFAPCTDGDGNTYAVVTIGNQTWMAENLRTAKYKDGSGIPYVTDNTAWSGLSTGAYCTYNNDPVNGTIYGFLYNWYAVNTLNLCPTGWHVPSYGDLLSLNATLGGELVAGGKLKETGTLLWQSPNFGATNETGFSALPGGIRNNYGTYGSQLQHGYWWSSTEDDTDYAYGFEMSYSSGDNYLPSDYKKEGWAVRCIKD